MFFIFKSNLHSNLTFIQDQLLFKGDLFSKWCVCKCHFFQMPLIFKSNLYSNVHYIETLLTFKCYLYSNITISLALINKCVEIERCERGVESAHQHGTEVSGDMLPLFQQLRRTRSMSALTKSAESSWRSRSEDVPNPERRALTCHPDCRVCIYAVWSLKGDENVILVDALEQVITQLGILCVSLRWV